MNDALGESVKKQGRAAAPKAAGQSTPGDDALARLHARIADLEKQVEAKRFASEQADLVREQFADLYDYAPVGYLTVDARSVIHRVNLPAAAFLGGSRQEVTGARLLSFIRPGEKAACAAFLKGAFSATGPTTFEFGLLPRRWRAEHVQLVASPAAAGRDLGHAGAQVRLAILDVSARKRADEALRASERKFEAVVSAMAEGVVAHDATGVIVMCNTAAERILGLSADEIRGRTSVDPRWRSVHEDGTPFPGEDHPAMVALRTGRSQWNVVMGLHRIDESLVWVRVNAEPLRNGDRSVHGVVVTFADVTEDRRKSAELRETSARLALVLEGANDGYWDWDLPTGRLETSDRMASMFGYTPREMTRHVSTWGRLVHPDDRDEARADMQQVMAGGVDRYEVERRLRHRDGNWVWVLVRGKVAERDATGRPTRMAGTYTDITRRKSIERALEDALGQLRRHLTNTPLGLVEWDAEFRVTRFSARAEAMFGRTADEVLGKRIDEVPWVAEEDWPPVRRVLQDLLEGVRPPYVNVSRGLRKDGSIIHCEWYNSPLYGPDGKLVSVFSLVQDVTDREQARESHRRSRPRRTVRARGS